MTKPWDMVQALYEELDDIKKPKHQKFVINLFENLDPSNPYDELTDGQLKYLTWLYNGYVNWDWEGY